MLGGARPVESSPADSKATTATANTAGDTKLTVVLGPTTAVSVLAVSKEACPTCGAVTATDDEDDASATTSPSTRRVQWLRAAVLGASDGLVSTAALMLGVGAARPADLRAVVLTGLAGLVAGACSMAIGEYVSVHAQLDVELAAERKRGPLAGGRGRPELPSPGQAAAASAMSFAAGAAVPLLAAWFVGSYKARVAVVVATATVALAAFGSIGAVLGRAPSGRAGLRADVGGMVAMGITYGLMKVFRTRAEAC